MADIAALLTAIATLIWPLLAGVALLILWPTVRALISVRGFKLKVGDMEISVQEASEQLRKQLEDLQNQMILLRQSVPHAGSSETQARLSQGNDVIRRVVLWVDDEPVNNTYEFAWAREQGWEVIPARSTAEALRVLTSGLPPTVLITDMRRPESPDAGLGLIEAAREVGYSGPIVVYTGRESVARWGQRARDLGARLVTSSAVEVFEALGMSANPLMQRTGKKPLAADQER